jgi:uncharacterized protein with von Willebrand factor type A (vWA) domain
MNKLRGLSWSTLWLSPLAADPAYRPDTEAMRLILPMIDQIGDGSSAQTLAAEVMSFAKGAR